MKKLRLLVTVTNDLSYDQRMQRICTSLVQAGYVCTLIGRKRPSSKPLPSFYFQTRRLNCFFQKGKFFYLEYNFRLFLYLLFQPSDAIYSVDLDTILPGTLVGWLRKKKRIYDAHEYFTEVPEVVNRPMTQKIWEKVADWAIPKSDLCFTVGEELSKIFSERYHKPFGVVRNVPVSYQQSEAPIIKTEKFILYQGALNEGRGLEELIKAASKLPIPIKIAGEGDLSQELRDLVRKEDAEDRVDFLGFIEPKQLKSLTKTAFLGYNLLENKGLSYYYSLANKFFDYAHAGVPCLNSEFPEYLNFQAKYEMSVICCLAKNDIIAAVNTIMSDSAQYQSLQDNCLKAAKELNWEKESQHLVHLIERVVE